ncbi:hypothetical protein [Klebsiella variicola]|uniref:hypothetical protein n=1 Tax=Klebsiella variicola TaxID=244366 RepID=UPI0012B74145|nr:hypothetical protein [Klebsiella variicola]
MSKTTQGHLAMASGICLPLSILRSRAGFYIGTKSPDLGPVSRESVEYYYSRLLAEKALADNSWTQRRCP